MGYSRSDLVKFHFHFGAILSRKKLIGFTRKKFDRKWATSSNFGKIGTFYEGNLCKIAHFGPIFDVVASGSRTLGVKMAGQFWTRFGTPGAK